MGESSKPNNENHSKHLKKTHKNLADKNHNDPREPALMILTADSLNEDGPREVMTAIRDDC